MKKKFLIVFLPLYLTVIFMLVFPFNNWQITLPGNVTDVSKNVSYEKSLEDSFFTTYVINYDKPTLLQLILTKLDKKTTLSKNVLIDYYYDSFLDEELSYQYALINAYLKAKEHNDEVSLSHQLKGYSVVLTKNKTMLKDLIIAFDGIPFTNFSTNQELSNYLKEKETVKLNAIRNNEEIEYQIFKQAGYFNLTLKPYFEIESFNPVLNFSYQDDKIGGPSGGLIQSLYLYYLITEKELTIKVGGTGTISFNGEVGAIGGIKEKIFTANNKVELFFCPKENYQAALEAYQMLKKPSYQLKMVESFSEALDFLKAYEK